MYSTSRVGHQIALKIFNDLVPSNYSVYPNQSTLRIVQEKDLSVIHQGITAIIDNSQLKSEQRESFAVLSTFVDAHQPFVVM